MARHQKIRPVSIRRVEKAAYALSLHVNLYGLILLIFACHPLPLQYRAMRTVAIKCVASFLTT